MSVSEFSVLQNYRCYRISPLLIDSDSSANFSWVSVTHPFCSYSRTLLMWTPEGQAKSVHNIGVSTLMKQLVSTPAKRIV